MQISFRFFIPILLFFTKSIIAIEFDHIIAFGDSYSDNGKGVFNISNGRFPPYPYFEGRFSNGPVWVEYFSKKLDTPLVDRAVGGATSNSMSVPGAAGINDEIIVPGIRQQIDDFMVDEHNSDFRKDKKIPPKNLFVVSTFGNDYIYSIRHGLRVVRSERVIGDLIASLQTLTIEFSAKHFVVTNLPNLSKFPGFSKSNETEKAYLSKLVENHNELLKMALAIFKKDFRGANVFLLDVDKFFQKFDSTEFEESCISVDRNGYHVCDDPDKVLFWDNLNVNTRIHEMLASDAFTCTKSMPSSSKPFKIC